MSRVSRSQRKSSDRTALEPQLQSSSSLSAAAAAPAAAASATSPAASPAFPRFRICIVSDFFYPRLGGVELHQYSLAQALQALGHKVVVITGTYEDEGMKRQGVRYCTNGLKVYYCPMMSISQQASLPTLFAFWPLLRSILLRERIQIVHGHQSTSGLAHEALLHARTMGLPTVFTDHSLFGFANTPAIHLNKLMKFSLSDANHVICVSHCSKENLCIRAMLDPEMVSVIPNAVDTTKLLPLAAHEPPLNSSRFTIVVLSRLVYRKGIDLILEVIPQICARHPEVDWIIGGDGPKRVLLDQMREKYAFLSDRVEMIGAVPHESIRSVLTRGHLFLNASLTEAFCIAILEAVSCGLYVVSTRVGGVPEILPGQLMSFAEPHSDDLVRVLSNTIPVVRARMQAEPGYGWRVHKQVREMYNWHMVARRTQIVYANVMQAWEKQRREDSEENDDEPEPAPPALVYPGDSCVELLPPVRVSRLRKFYACGPLAGPLFVLVVLFDHLLLRALAWARPAADMDVAVDFEEQTTAAAAPEQTEDQEQRAHSRGEEGGESKDADLESKAHAKAKHRGRKSHA